jgi:hypothetical protein
MVRVGIQADHDCFRKKPRNPLIRSARVENIPVHTWQEVLLKAADGFRRAKDSSPDAIRIKAHERAVSLLNFDDSILYCHWPRLYKVPGRSPKTKTASGAGRHPTIERTSIPLRRPAATGGGGLRALGNNLGIIALGLRNSIF